MVRRAKGFTLLELMTVLTIIAVLTSMAVPMYGAYVHRARVAEAYLQVETIAYLEEVRVLELGAPIALERNPPTRPGTQPGHFRSTEAWRDLGLDVSSRVYFQYWVELDGEDHYTVFAEGDPDGDGRPLRVTLSSRDLELSRGEVPP